MRATTADRTEDIVGVVLAARERALGLTSEQARLAPETSVLGVLTATGKITARQYEAGASYREVCRQYDRMLDVRPLTSAGDLDRGHGHDNADGTDPEYRARYNRAVAAYDRCVLALANAGPMVRVVVNACAVSDLRMPAFDDQLRDGLNALGAVLGLPLDKPEERAHEIHADVSRPEG